MKVWEKMLLYPIGLCCWFADSAKKTGNFIGRKAKPAIAMLVAVTMMLSLMPITAFAVSSDIIVGGANLGDGSTTVYYKNGDTSGNLTGTAEDYNAKLETVGGVATLTIKNLVVAKTADAGIKSYVSLNLVLEGASSIAEKDDDSWDCRGIRVDGDLTISGDGVLSVTAGDAADDGSYGIYVNGALTIKSGTINATGGTASGGSYGIYATAVLIHDGTVNATGGSAGVTCGIYSDDVRVTGGVTVATGGTASGSALTSYGISISSYGDATVTTTGGVLVARAGSGTTAKAINGTLTTNGTKIAGQVVGSTFTGSPASYDGNATALAIVPSSYTVQNTKLTEDGVTEYTINTDTAVVVPGSTDSDIPLTLSSAGGTVTLTEDLVLINLQGKNYTPALELGGASNRAVTVNGSGTLTAIGAANKDYSYGIVGLYRGGFSVNGAKVIAIGGTASNKSYGIGYSVNVNVSSGSVVAIGGSASGSSYGISATTTVNGGTLNAIGGKASTNSYGINGRTTANGGTLNAIGGVAADTSYGIYCESILGVSVANEAKVAAIGGNYGLYTESGSLASGDYIGSTAAIYCESGVNSLLANGYSYYSGDTLLTPADSDATVGEANQTVTVKEAPIPHSHCVCGAEHKSIGDHTTETSKNFEAWDNATSLPQSGSYYLNTDVVLTATANITGELNLCLNGHIISAAGGYFDVAGTGTLNLCSCKDNGIIKRTTTTNALISADAGATANLYNVTLDGGAVWEGTTDTVLKRGTTNSGITSSAPLIYAGGQRTAGGHITLNSGVILQNNECSDAGDGGAITLGEDGTLVINGATICNNAKTSGNAGAIKAYAGAQITVNSGEIYGNEAYKHGGAIQIFGGDSTDYADAVLTMNGSTIRNNKADGVGGGVAVSDYSSFTMNGGTIKDNATTDYSKRGGGVGFADADTEMAISGDAVIADNEANGAANNLYIGTNSCNTVAVGEMENGASIGVTMKSSSGGVFTSGGAAYAECFESDDPAYTAAVDGENLKLIKTPAEVPNVQVSDNLVLTYGEYTGQKFTATVEKKDGYTYVYQWIDNNEVISNTDTLTIPDDLAVGVYDYALAVGAKRDDNGEIAWETIRDILVTVNPKALDAANVALSQDTFTYNGNEQKPSVTVSAGSKTLIENADYTLSWSADCTNAGSKTVTVTFKGNYSGEVTKNFKIEKADIFGAQIILSKDTFTYNGQEQKPEVTVTFNGKTLTTADYELYFMNADTVMQWEAGRPVKFFGKSQSDSINANTYYAVVYGKGNFVENSSFAYAEYTIDQKELGIAWSNTALTYNGAAQRPTATATGVVTGEQIALLLSAPETNAGSYTATVHSIDGATAQNYKLPINKSTSFTISKAEPSIVWNTGESNTYGKNMYITAYVNGVDGNMLAGTAEAAVYDASGNKLTSVICTKANPTGTYYFNWMNELSDGTYLNPGSYLVKLTYRGNENYNDKTVDLVTYTINKATYDMSEAKWDYTDAFKYDGKEHKVEVVGLPDGVTVSGYAGNAATAAGDYIAKVILTYDVNNYNAPSVADLNWKIENNWTPTEYAVNGSGWMNYDFVITANNGYKVSLTNTADGGWEDTLTCSAETDNGSVIFYLKNETDGTISLAKTVTYKLDKTAPTGTVEFVDRTGWQEFVNTITFGLFYKDEVTVKITAADDLSGVEKVEYYASDEALTLEQVKAITDWTAYSDSFGVTFEDAKKFVYYVRITDNAGNVTYISTDGAEYDITAPVIIGVENGKTYYTTQKVTVSDKNLDTVTLNGNAVTGTVTLDGDKDVTYTIVATDKAGNSTTVSVTMKPIRELAKATENLGPANVTSDDAPALRELIAKLNELLADEDVSDDGERETLEQHKSIAESLLRTIDDTKAELARIDEELNKHNGDTVNSDDAAALEQLAKDIQELLDGDNLTDAERTALTEDAGKVADMQKTVADTAAENKRISDAVDGYDLATVTSDDKADLEQLLADIEKQLESTNLTEEEISELNGDKKAVEDLLTKIKGTDELIDKLTEDVNEYSDETVKSTDKDAIEQIIEDIDALLETENLTEDEKKALEDAKDKAEGLLETIDDADKATETENTEKVKDVTAENVTPEDKTDLEKAKDDLEKALEDYGDNYTDDEKKAIEDEIDRIDDALEVIENVEKVEDKINALSENITKDDTDNVDAAKKAYDELSDYEKTLVDPEAKKKLDEAVKAAEEANKPADTDSPQTGDNSHMGLWFTLMLGSLAALFAIFFGTKKKKAEDK